MKFSSWISLSLIAGVSALGVACAPSESPSEPLPENTDPIEMPEEPSDPAQEPGQ